MCECVLFIIKYIDDCTIEGRKSDVSDAINCIGKQREVKYQFSFDKVFNMIVLKKNSLNIIFNDALHI